MDNRQVLINILKDMQNNIKVVLQLTKQPGDEPLQERFYRWLKAPFPLCTENEEITEISTCNQSMDEMVDAVNRFAQYVADEIAKGQTVDGCRTRLPRLREERERMETRLRQLKVDREHEEAFQRSELQSRFDLIQDLKTRLRETEERTTSCLRLAKYSLKFSNLRLNEGRTVRSCILFSCNFNIYFLLLFFFYLFF